MTPAARKPARWIAVTLALAGALAAFPSPVRAAVPWEFPGGAEELRQKQKEHGALGNKWYEDYEAALGLLKGRKPDLKQAIDRLRFAIRSKPASDPDARNDQTRSALPYFPYYWLARAFYLDQDYVSAQKCLQREMESRRIQGSGLAGDFAKLKADVDAIAAAGPLVADATKVLAWGEGQGEVTLSPAAAGSLPKIRTLRDRLADPKGADKGRATSELTSELGSLLRAQLAERGASLKSLGQEFPDAWAGRPEMVAASSCQAPAGDRTSEAVAALSRCAAAIAKAEARAGQSECEQLSAMRDGIRSRSEALSRWAGSGKGASGQPAVPDLPASCAGFQWTSSPAAQVSQELGRLRGQRLALRQKLHDAAASLDQSVARMKDEFNRNLEEAAALIPSLPQECVSALGLELTRRRLEDRRQKLKGAKMTGAQPPDPEMMLPATQLVKADLDAAVSGVEASVQSLVGRKAECEGVSTANLDTLPGLLTSWRGAGGRQADLNSLCAKARGAVSDIDACFERNTGSVVEDVRGYLPLLRAAQGAAPQECFQQGIASLSRVGNPPASNVAPWVRTAREAIRGAQSCLATLRGETEARWSEAHPGFTRVADLLGDSAESPAGLDAETSRRIERVRGEIKDAAPRVEKLAPLYALKDETIPEGADLRQALTGAGLAGRLGPDAWQLLEGARARGPRPYADAWRALRDSAASAELARIGEKLPEWERVARNMGPYVTLARALDAYAKGDLDGAILTLRTARGRGLLPSEGRPAALAHAALACFLHVKKRMVEGSTDAARLMERDIEKEARAAVRADAGIRQVAGTLFGNESFGEYLQRIN